ncbi:putative Ribosomal protein arginine N-methytransferase rmt3 [Venustampulla echinocandica]|uniref:type I protein arginine methyltransferase n=1 Tax=Venustampulla echinocandica TaxID=2656787 RepID=A0A370TNW8_9HELO|nr:putative Ribosomal protein arginine N-methytransferase rmt3 [Venustampulla echinocandica]RDL37215.1 putative Ribosomal protein arginine N-methytransferase rmt3 [Venustampulla echinocandica]
MSESAPPTEKKENAPPSSVSSEASDILDLRDDEGWEDAEPDEEESQFISLLDDEVFTDIMSMLNHCKDKYSFDFLEVRQKLGLDFYGNIKLVNYIRSQVHNGLPIPSDISRKDFDDEAFLKPVLEDDALLFSLDDLPDIVEAPHDAHDKGKGVEKDPRELISRVSELEEELRKIKFQFDGYRATVKETLDKKWDDQGASGQSGSPEKEEKRDDDSHYFSSYSYNDIHETMLKDSVRTDAYRDFIYNNKSLFAGKTVLDVGCGTGILSMFCAKAGATRVIAVDNSAIIDKARENIFNNGFADTITCLRGKIEEVTLPVDKVDIIVSEWMGYCLLYEAMLDSVIWARDRYLRPDGLMVPSHMNMWMAPIADPDYIADHISFWRDVYGFDMKAMQAGIHEDAQVLDMPASTLCAEPFPFMQLELHSTSVKDLVFKIKWQAKLKQDIDALDGFIIWFDTFFMPSRGDTLPEDAKAEEWASSGKKGTAFTTGPGGKVTHWKQGVLLIDNTANKPASRKAGEQVSGELEYSVPENNSRALNVGTTWKFDGEGKENSQLWKMR